MKSSKHKFFLLQFLAILSSLVTAQEPFNIETQFANLGRNPALTGIQVDDLKINLCYSHQVQKILLPYRALQIQIESRFNQQESVNGFSVGALIRYDEAGENKLKRAQFLPALNFHKSLSDVKTSYLSVGFMPGIFKTQYDYNLLPTTINFDPIPFNPLQPVPQNIVALSSSCLDFSTGLSLFAEINPHFSFTLGAGLFHFCQNLLKQNENSIHLPREWVINTDFFIYQEKSSFHFITDARIRKMQATMFTSVIWSVPIHENYLHQLSELQLGIYYNSLHEYAGSIAYNWFWGVLSIGFNMQSIRHTMYPVLGQAFETNLSFNMNCHKRSNESEKMRCHY